METKMGSAQVTAKFFAFISEKVDETLKKYDDFRSDLAKSGQDPRLIREAAKDEIFWENKIKALKNLVRNKVIITPENQREIIKLGSRFILGFPDGKDYEYVLDGAGYKSGKIKIISYQSKIGSQLLGKKFGETVGNFVVKDISYPW